MSDKKIFYLIMSLISSVFAIIFFGIGLYTGEIKGAMFGFIMLIWQIFWMSKIKKS